MERCAIVIPLYKTDLNPFEAVSLRQTFQLLGAYPVIVVAPEGLELDLEEYGKAAQVERFSEGYFNGTLGYSALMLSEDFYSRFLDYEYILLVQTDAFVFADRLLAFCDRGFDYIGAPLPQWWWTGSGIKGDGRGVVGNGGFSLRNVRRTLSVVRQKERILWKRPDRAALLKDEDKFFGVCSEIDFLNYRAADLRTAERFSVEFDVSGSYGRINSGHLPFGCHGWWNSEFAFWRPYVESCGYNFTESDIAAYTQSDMSKRIYQDNLNGYLLGLQSTEALLKSLELPSEVSSRRICVWGAGDVGRRCCELLAKMWTGADIMVISKSPVAWANTLFPSDDILQNGLNYFILASTKYEQEMRRNLLLNNRVEQKDFISYTAFATRIVKKLYPDKWNDYGFLDGWISDM